MARNRVLLLCVLVACCARARRDGGPGDDRTARLSAHGALAPSAVSFRAGATSAELIFRVFGKRYAFACPVHPGAWCFDIDARLGFPSGSTCRLETYPFTVPPAP